MSRRARVQPAGQRVRLVVVEWLTMDAGRANVARVAFREGCGRVDLVVWVEVALLLRRRLVLRWVQMSRLRLLLR